MLPTAAVRDRNTLAAHQQPLPSVYISRLAASLYTKKGRGRKMMVLLGVSRSMAMQSAKMRIPSIKFRYGRQTGHQHATGASPTSQTSGAARSATVATTLDEHQLPARFYRQPISQEEIDYINRGGPA